MLSHYDLEWRARDRRRDIEGGLDRVAVCLPSSERSTSSTRALQPGLVLLVVAALMALYVGVLHPWLLNWGSTEAEQRMVLPGDEATPDPSARLTRAVTIDAPPSQVWPWLLQIGQDRAGFYSNDWLENLAGADIHNGNEIRPEWQQREIGDAVPMVRTDILGGVLGEAVLLRVNVMQPKTVIGDIPGRFVLLPANDHATRLLLREPLRGPDMGEAFAYWIWDPIHFVMEQRMLRGIKERADGRPFVPIWLQAMARIGWLLSGLAVACLFLSRRRWLPWGLLSAGLVVPSLSSTGDFDAALAGFLALGISLLGLLAYGRRWIAPYLPIAAAVLLALLLAPDAYVALGLVFDLIAVALAVRALGFRPRLGSVSRARDGIGPVLKRSRQ